MTSLHWKVITLKKVYREARLETGRHLGAAAEERSREAVRPGGEQRSGGGEDGPHPGGVGGKGSA